MTSCSARGLRRQLAQSFFIRPDVNRGAAVPATETSTGMLSGSHSRSSGSMEAGPPPQSAGWAARHKVVEPWLDVHAIDRGPTLNPDQPER
jgi:hypothetical protein